MDHTVLFCLSSAASCDAEETLGVCVWGSVPTNELGLESCVAKKDRSLPLHVLFPPLGMPFPFTSAPTCPYLSGKLPPIFQGAVQEKPLAPHTLLLPTPRPSYPSFCNCRIAPDYTLPGEIRRPCLFCFTHQATSTVVGCAGACHVFSQQRNRYNRKGC